MSEEVPARMVLANIIGQAVYWHIPGAKRVMDWGMNLSRPAGFNPTVDERRELTIRMKLHRGQKFITKPDAWFLLFLLTNERVRVEQLEKLLEGKEK